MRKFCDSHTDFMTKIKTLQEKVKYTEEIKNLGALKILSAIFTTKQNIKLNQIKSYKNEIDQINKKVGNVLRFCVEDLGNIELNELEELLTLAPFSATLTWNYENVYGGGAESQAGLSKQGFYTCELLEKNGVLIDTAHQSRKSFNDFCSITTKPIFNSHTNINSIHKHRRNLNDDQIEQIVASNGFLGLTIYRKFISQNEIYCKDIALQFAFLADNFGCDNFGLGTDLYGIDKIYMPKNFESYKDLQKLETELKKVGFNDVEIDKFFYDNFLKFYEKA